VSGLAVDPAVRGADEPAPAAGSSRGAVGLGLLGLGALLAAGAGLGLGALPITAGELWQIAAAGPAAAPVGLETAAAVVWSLRLPRVLLGLAVGAALGAAGATLQGVFRNPLADPGVVGSSAGAALAAGCFLVLPRAALPAPAWALEALAAVGLPGAAFLGAAAATGLALALGRSSRSTQISELLLVGVALNALCGAGLGLLMALSDEVALRDLSFWMLGALGGATWPVVALTAPVALLGVALSQPLARGLDALALGEGPAAHLGVPVERLKATGVALSAALVGGAVAAAGMIGFVGLAVPHLVRLLLGPSHRAGLPGSALLGAGLLVAADTLARLVLAPAELPVGVLTTLLGAPLFFGLLLRARRARGAA
jgi:iron complex transport system permease protein